MGAYSVSIPPCLLPNSRTTVSSGVIPSNERLRSSEFTSIRRQWAAIQNFEGQYPGEADVQEYVEFLEAIGYVFRRTSIMGRAQEMWDIMDAVEIMLEANGYNNVNDIAITKPARPS